MSVFALPPARPLSRESAASARRAEPCKTARIKTDRAAVFFLCSPKALRPEPPSGWTSPHTCSRGCSILQQDMVQYPRAPYLEAESARQPAAGPQFHSRDPVRASAGPTFKCVCHCQFQPHGLPSGAGERSIQDAAPKSFRPVAQLPIQKNAPTQSRPARLRLDDRGQERAYPCSLAGLCPCPAAKGFRGEAAFLGVERCRDRPLPGERH